FVSYNGGTDWSILGTSFPLVAVDQLDLDSSHRLMAAGTHGRGAFAITDTLATPALVLTKVSDNGVPVGPGTPLTYALTLRNEGNASANGVKITDPVPDNTSFVSADSGGTKVGDKATWTGITLAPGASVTVHFTVSIANDVKKKVTSIVNDGIEAR